MAGRQIYDINGFSGRSTTVEGILGGYVAYFGTRRDGRRTGEGKLADEKRLNNGILPADSYVCDQLLEAKGNASRVGNAIKEPGTLVNEGVNSNRGIGATLPSNFTLVTTIGDTRFGIIPYTTLRPPPRRRR